MSKTGDYSEELDTSLIMSKESNTGSHHLEIHQTQHQQHFIIIALPIHSSIYPQYFLTSSLLFIPSIFLQLPEKYAFIHSFFKAIHIHLLPCDWWDKLLYILHPYRVLCTITYFLHGTLPHLHIQISFVSSNFQQFVLLCLSYSNWSYLPLFPFHGFFS